MRCAVMLVVCALFSSPAIAQSAYVVGAFGLDVSRSGSVESGSDLRNPTTDGEVASGSFRLGTAVGDRWGVEVEIARGRETEDRVTYDTRFPIVWTSDLPSPVPPRGATIADINTVLPGIGLLSYSLELRQQDTTLNTVAWFRQPIGDRAELVYLGGVTFLRGETTQIVETSRPIPFPVIPPISTETTIVDYAVGAVVGFEGRIGFTEGVRLVPGVRLHGVANRWIVRPSIGIGWFF